MGGVGVEIRTVTRTLFFITMALLSVVDGRFTTPSEHRAAVHIMFYIYIYAKFVGCGWLHVTNKPTKHHMAVVHRLRVFSQGHGCRGLDLVVVGLTRTGWRG